MESTELNERVNVLLDRIDAFDRVSESIEYTDTGDIWDLLRDAASLLAELTGHKGSEEIELDDLTDTERAKAERFIEDFTHLYRLADGRAIAQAGREAIELTPTTND